MHPDYDHISKIRAENRKAFLANCAWCEEIEKTCHVPSYDMYKFYQGVPSEEQPWNTLVQENTPLG